MEADAEAMREIAAVEANKMDGAVIVQAVVQGEAVDAPKSARESGGSGRDKSARESGTSSTSKLGGDGEGEAEKKKPPKDATKRLLSFTKGDEKLYAIGVTAARY